MAELLTRQIVYEYQKRLNGASRTLAKSYNASRPRNIWSAKR